VTRLALSQDARMGLALGFGVSPVAVLLALPNISLAYRVQNAVNQGSFANIATNVVPVVLLTIVGSLAARRGFRAHWVGVISGGLYGFVQGLVLYLIALFNPDKHKLAATLWAAYLKAGYIETPARRLAVEGPALHPSPVAYLLGLAAQMLLLGLLFGWLGGRLVRRPSPAQDTRTAPSSKAGGRRES
jgi:hypothetical protein